MLARLTTGLVLASTVTSLAGTVGSNELQPSVAERVTLGPISGVVYFTEQDGADQLVATLGAGDTAPTVRFEASLGAGQSAVISVPQEAGKPAIRVRFARRGERVLVIREPAL